MDAHALELDDDSFDLTGSQFGVMLVPDQPIALREMVRVTKPGGRVLLIAYGPPAESKPYSSSSPRYKPSSPTSKDCQTTLHHWSSRLRTPRFCAND